MVHKLNARSERGSVIVIVAISMVVLLGMSALVVDLGTGRQKRRQIQSTADAAALAGAQEFLSFNATPTVANWNAVANTVRTFALQNASVPNADWSSCSDPDRGAYTVIPSTVPVGSCVSVDSVSNPVRLRVKVPPRTLQTGFARVIGFNTLTVGAKAIAEVGTTSVLGALPCAICALGTLPNPDPGIQVIGLQGNPELVVTSDSDAGIRANGGTHVQGNNSELQAPSIVITGSATGNGTYAPPPSQGAAVTDPIAGLVTPPPYSTNPPPPNSAGSGLIQPGTYNNIIAGNHATLTLAPGVYVVTGQLGAASHGQITGTGVMIYFTATATLSIGNQEGITLSAPTSGPYKGITLYFDPSNTTTIDLQAGGGLSVAGTIYAAGATLDLQGGPSAVSFDSAIVVRKVTAGGNGTINVNYQSEQNVQIPTTVHTAPNLYR